MAAARAANAPQFMLDRDASAQDIPPAVSGDSPWPRAAPWRAVRAPRGPIARWLGIGSGVLLVGLLAVTVVTQPIRAEIERLIGPWLTWQQDREAAAPPTDRGLSATPEPAAGRDDPQPDPVPVLARETSATPALPGAAAPAAEVATPDPASAPAGDEPAARSVPVPSLKPPLHR
jgi:hypothetical protein